MKKLSMLCALLSVIGLAGCNTGGDVPYNEDDFETGGYDAPALNERTSHFMQADNQYAGVSAHRPRTQEEMAASNAKWDTSRKEIRWREYRGTMVRVEILLGDTDMREMRTRLMQNASGQDVDGDARHVISRVADFEMKRVCGRNAESYVIVYDRPSFDVVRPTPYFDYRIEAAGSTMREFGFRCIFNN